MLLLRTQTYPFICYKNYAPSRNILGGNRAHTRANGRRLQIILQSKVIRLITTRALPVNEKQIKVTDTPKMHANKYQLERNESKLMVLSLVCTYLRSRRVDYLQKNGYIN